MIFRISPPLENGAPLRAKQHTCFGISLESQFGNGVRGEGFTNERSRGVFGCDPLIDWANVAIGGRACRTPWAADTGPPLG